MQKSTKLVKNSLTVGLWATILVGCGGSTSFTQPEASTVASTTAAPAPPQIDLPTEVRAEVGTVVDVELRVTSEGEAEISWQGLPPGARVVDGGSLRWTADDADTWVATVTAADGGLSTSAEITLVARHEVRPDTLVAMGDSVAAGHGRDPADYLGGDPCFRSDDKSYGPLVHAQLVASGRFTGAGEVVHVACTGFDSEAVLTSPVSGSLVGVDGEERPQVEWAVRANPALVTLTVGGNDIDFRDGCSGVVDGRLDRTVVEERLNRLEEGLTAILDRIHAATDATIAVTTYYDPSADEPAGIEGCRGECFKAVIAEAVTMLNDVISTVVGRYGDRAVVVEVRDRFAGHGAPNGVGPDDIRGNAEELIGGALGELLSDLHPYCAADLITGDSWISRVDCTHPNDRGQQEMAAAVVEALG